MKSGETTKRVESASRGRETGEKKRSKKRERWRETMGEQAEGSECNTE
jgi:hypothetical protein